MAHSIVQDIKTLTLAEMASVYNLLSERSIKKFSDRETALIRTENKLEKAHKVVARRPDGTLQIMTPEKAVEEAIHRNSNRYHNTSTITLMISGNPKRKGSKSHARFELYKTGMTVAEYKKEVAALQGTAKRVFDDMKYDIEHGYIELTASSQD